MGITATIARAFHGGVHPHDNKALSEHCAIEPIPMPKRLYVPLHQHIGGASDPVVLPGAKVYKGQLLGKPSRFVSSTVHAPTSGTIVDVTEYTVGHPSGLTMLSAVLEPDGKDEWDPGLKGLDDPFNADPEAIRKKVKEAGIVGMGGATFPSFIKLTPHKGEVVEQLIINGAECEPYLTSDSRVMQERAQFVVEGAAIIARALPTSKVVIGIEANKPAAIEAIRKAIKGYDSMRVEVLNVRYPQGSASQLIEALTGRQVPAGGHSIDVGVIVYNVATACAVREAVLFGRPQVQRVVSVTGFGINRPANLDVLIGTPVSELIDRCGGLKPGVKKVVNGGPMMGVALGNLDVPVVKGTTGIVCMLGDDIGDAPEKSCIRCSRCVDVCPVSLMPTEMAFYAKHDKLELLQEYDIFECIECGSCAFVCPSHIPLVHYFRYGKMAIWGKENEKRKLQKDKERMQAKEERVARENAEKERKKAELKARAGAPRPAATPPAPTGEAAPAAKAAAAPAEVSEPPAPTPEAAVAATEAAPTARPRTTRAPRATTAPAAEVAATQAPAQAEGDDPAAAAAAEKAARAARAAAAARAARAARAATAKSEPSKDE